MTGLPVCYIQETCPHFLSGDNKPPNHHVRVTIPCTKMFDYSCEMEINLRLWHGEVIACSLADRQKFATERASNIKEK